MDREACSNFKFLCCLFCCPPCPSRITAKLAFMPPEPTYKFDLDESGSRVLVCTSRDANLHLRPDELNRIEVFYTRTSRGHQIACMFIRGAPNARKTMLCSHGNAVDLGNMSAMYISLGIRFNCNIFAYDYSGYGQSEGQASEKNLYADIEAAWQAVQNRYGVSPENLILYGTSIGTVPAIDLASKHEVGGVVLHAPLMSGVRVAFPNIKRTWCFDSLLSIEKVPKITSPVLVIHGTNDEVIDFSHGQAIYELCPRPVEPLWIEGAGHNDIELFEQYVERLERFINTEIAH